MYDIVITKRRELSEDERKELLNRRRGFGMDDHGELGGTVEKHLQASLTDDEFAAVKKAVLEVM